MGPRKRMSLSIAICTRGREAELAACFKSIVKSLTELGDRSVQIVIIDDSRLSKLALDGFTKTCRNLQVDFVYKQKREPGLYNSRLQAIELSACDIVLFLDDDVLLDRDYLKLIIHAFEHDEIGGVSGIDNNLRNATRRMLLYQSLFLHSSFKPGSLSLTGFNGSITRWPSMKTAFQTDFFSGCNMAFKRVHLLDLPQVSTFNGYSVGEDIFISHCVALKAPLLVNPKARVDHNQSLASRDSARAVSRSMVVNHYFLLHYFHTAWWRRTLFYWSIAGLLFKDLYDLCFLIFKGGHEPRKVKIEEVVGKLSGLRSTIW
jgi:glycosyltransferase involved in cell wall biosynthesis